MYTPQDEINLVSNLIDVLGLNINPIDNILISQETGTQLIFMNKNIKASKNINKPPYISDNDILFEPINKKSLGLMSKLFGWYLDTNMNELGEAKIFYFDEKKENRNEKLDKIFPKDPECKLVVVFKDGRKFETPYRRNKALLYSEAILRLDGSFEGENYSIFDLDPNMPY